MSDPSPAQRHIKIILDLIDEYGRAVQGIFDPEGKEPPYHYTVGNAEQGLPEVIVSGLCHDVGHYVVNRASREALEGTVTLVPGTVLTGYLGSDSEYDAVVCAVSDRHGASIARILYGSNVEVVQLVYTDAAGRYPWDLEYKLAAQLQRDWFLAPHSLSERAGEDGPYVDLSAPGPCNLIGCLLDFPHTRAAHR